MLIKLYLYELYFEICYKPIYNNVKNFVYILWKEYFQNFFLIIIKLFYYIINLYLNTLIILYLDFNKSKECFKINNII